MKHKYGYIECLEYCKFDNLPEGIEEKYKYYEPDNVDKLMPKDFLTLFNGKYRSAWYLWKRWPPVLRLSPSPAARWLRR
jgi:hypothetical protein